MNPEIKTFAACCQRCRRVMSATPGCDPVPFPDGTPFVAYGSETWLAGATPGPRCHDCGAEVGQPHHYACDAEQCPACRGQLLYCACWAAWFVDEAAGDDAPVDPRVAEDLSRCFAGDDETAIDPSMADELARWFAEGGA